MARDTAIPVHGRGLTRLHNGLIEGINKRIKVIRRMACGCRDEACLFLGIRAAFPGIAR